MVLFNTRLALAMAALSTVSSGQAFVGPNFSVPRQCADLKVTWSTSDFRSISITASDTVQSSISLTLIPLDIDPAHPAPPPFSFEMPCNDALDASQTLREFTVPRLPFPAGTQFFASMHVPDAAGVAGQLARRRVSDILQVTHSLDDSCLPVLAPPEGRTRVKKLGRVDKRQIRVIGQSSIDANAPISPQPTGGNTPAIQPLGPPAFVPVDQTSADNSNPVAAPPANVAPAPNSNPVTTTPVPIIKELGHSTLPLDGEAAPPPSADVGATEPPTTDAPPTDGPAPPIDEPAPPTDELDSPTDEPTPPMDESPMDEPSMDEPAPPPSRETEATQKPCEDKVPESSSSPDEQKDEDSRASWDDRDRQDWKSPDYSNENSQPSSEDDWDENSDSYNESKYDWWVPTPEEFMEDYIDTMPPYPKAKDQKASSDSTESPVIHYDSLKDMVDHANLLFKAWNPHFD